MADFNWSFTPTTLAVVANAVVMVVGGNIWYKKYIGMGMDIDNTGKLQNLATEAVSRLDARNVALEMKIERDRQRQEDTEAELTIVREYILRDSVWHIQVLGIIESLGGAQNIPAAPVLPPRRREFKPDEQHEAAS